MENTRTATPLPPIRKVDAGRGMQWFTDGWRMFAASPGTWIAIIVVWVVIPGALQFAGTTAYLISQFVGPFLSAGVLICARDQDLGTPLRFERLFAGFKAEWLKPLLILGLYNFAMTLAVYACALAVVVPLVGTDVVMSLFSSDISDVASLDYTAIIIALLVAAPILLTGFFLISMAFWFAPGLIVVNGVSPWRALVLSFRTMSVNIGALVVFDLVSVVLGIAAILPLGLGLFVLGPVMACAWYASWRDVFGEQAPAPATTR